MVVLLKEINRVLFAREIQRVFFTNVGSWKTVEVVEVVVELQTSNSTIEGATDSNDVTFDSLRDDIVWNWV